MFFDRTGEHVCFEDTKEQFLFEDGKAIQPNMYNENMLVNL